MGDKDIGWIRLHRQIKDNPIFENEKLLKVWIWCLLEATYKPYKKLVGRQIVHLNKGQFVTGRHAAGRELNMAPSTAWDYLKILENNDSIQIKSNNKFSVVTVVNWELYQPLAENDDSKHDSKTTEGQQQNNTNNKGNNINNLYIKQNFKKVNKFHDFLRHDYPPGFFDEKAEEDKDKRIADMGIEVSKI